MVVLLILPQLATRRRSEGAMDWSFELMLTDSG
jgi:hypothetical protein